MPAPGQPEDASFPGEFVPSESGKDCDKFAGGWGVPMTDFEYIWYANADEKKYPSDACRPYYHKAAQIDFFKVNNKLTVNEELNGSCNIKISGTITAADFFGNWYGNSVGAVKAFDIPHPSKEGYRLRYICLEGPEAEVYLRGKLESSNVIELPDYWKNLVDIETIGVTLTPIGVYQELYVDKIESGQKIIVKNNSSGPIKCSYVVYGQRKDIARNISEYEGTSAKDYPGNIAPYTP